MVNTRTLARTVLPEGTLPVGVGLALSGATTYAFLAVVARALGPERYAPFAGLWSFLFLLAPALFAPFEQEVGRALAARRALDQTVVIVLRRAAIALAAVCGGGIVLSLAGAPLLSSRLFDGDPLLFAALLLGLCTYSTSSFLKGMLSGSGRFRNYGAVLGAEGLFRVAASMLLLVFGVATPGPFALAVALAPLSGFLFLVRLTDETQHEDAPFAWSEILRSLWQLFLGSALAALIVNGAPVALKALSGPGDRAAVSRFTASLLIARVPLFLFQAIQVALLPKLSSLAASGRHDDFAVRLLRLLAFVTVAGVTSTLAASTIGPTIIVTMFGAGFSLGRGDLLLLGLASTAYMAALAFAQALIAYRRQGIAVWAWAAGCLTFGVALLLPTSLLFRVERALLAGSVAAALAMGVCVLRVLTQADRREAVRTGAA